MLKSNNRQSLGKLKYNLDNFRAKICSKLTFNKRLLAKYKYVEYVLSFGNTSINLKKNSRRIIEAIGSYTSHKTPIERERIFQQNNEELTSKTKKTCKVILVCRRNQKLNYLKFKQFSKSNKKNGSILFPF